jgi:hypothetical protein
MWLGRISVVAQFSIPILMAIVVCFAPALAEAGPYDFVKIADTSGQFSGFGYWPAINGSGQVVFAANLKSGGAGLYLGDGSTTTTISVNSSPAASAYSTFGTDQVINNAGEVAFCGSNLPATTSVYKWSGGAITTIASPSSMGSIGPWNPSINDHGTVVFLGQSLATGRTGIYSGSGGALSTVVDTAGLFSNFGYSPALNDSGTVAFSAVSKTTGLSGIYTLSSTGVLTTIADTKGSIADFAAGAVTINDSGTVAFMATLKSGGTAIYRGDGSTLDMIVDSSGPFTHFESQPMINNQGTVGFVGFTQSSTTGIYTGPDPIADKIVASGDVVDGSVLDQFSAWGFSFGDNGNATFATLSSNGYAIYAAHPVPEPSVFVFLGTGVLLLAASAWCRGRR